jgi:cytochrome b pre-mRNA-processing protein 3
MLGFLFRSLTADTSRGGALFDAVTKVAREPHWYVEGQVPDTIDGRFAVLATIAALVMVRLEQPGETGNALSVALTERFIEVMESEHRQIGLGDPTLGKTVRKLVGSLARRTELWRAAIAGQEPWPGIAQQSLYQDAVAPAAMTHCATALRAVWDKVRQTDLQALEEGRLQ